jgi:hypothetical protein
MFAIVCTRCLRSIVTNSTIRTCERCRIRIFSLWEIFINCFTYSWDVLRYEKLSQIRSMFSRKKNSRMSWMLRVLLENEHDWFYDRSWNVLDLYYDLRSRKMNYNDCKINCNDYKINYNDCKKHKKFSRMMYNFSSKKYDVFKKMFMIRKQNLMMQKNLMFRNKKSWIREKRLTFCRKNLRFRENILTLRRKRVWIFRHLFDYRNTSLRISQHLSSNKVRREHKENTTYSLAVLAAIKSHDFKKSCEAY